MSTNKGKMTRVVIANVFGSLNRGDAALVEVLVSDILAAFGPGTEISGIAFEPEAEEKHLPGVIWHERIGKAKFRNLLLRRITNVTFQASAALYLVLGCPAGVPFPLPRRQREAMRAIRDADVVISCAGGYLEDSNPSLLAAAVQLFVAHYYRKPLVMAPQSIGPVRPGMSRRFVGAAVRGARLICVREAISESFVLDDLRVDPATVHHSPDLALYHHEIDRDGGRAALAELGLGDQPILGCSVVGWSFPTSADREAARRSYEERYARLLRLLWEKYQRKILMVNQVSDDLPTARAIQKLAGDFVVVDTQNRTVPVIRGMIAQADYFVASRFHSCLFALLGGVPTTAFAYLPKSTGIMRLLGLEDRVYGITEFVPEQVAERIAQDLEAPDRVRTAIREAIAAYTAKHVDFKTLLGTVLERNGVEG